MEDTMVPQSLREEIKDIVKSVPHEKIIIFGSYAHGNQHATSDVDILVVINACKDMHQKIYLETQLRKRFAERMIDADVLGKDTKDIAYFRDKPGSVIRKAIEEGITI